jgi:hypothetical protein
MFQRARSESTTSQSPQRPIAPEPRVTNVDKGPTFLVLYEMNAERQLEIDKGPKRGCMGEESSGRVTGEPEGIYEQARHQDWQNQQFTRIIHSE